MCVIRRNIYGTRDMICIMLPCAMRRELIRRHRSGWWAASASRFKSGSRAKGWVWTSWTILKPHRASLAEPIFSRRTAALGPEFLLDYYVLRKKKGKKKERGENREQGPPHERVLSIRITNIRATRHAPWALNLVVA